jgi:protein SERAC1
MCKFDNENSPGFDLIVDGIQRYAEEAPDVIRARWLAEKEERLNLKIQRAKELVPLGIGESAPGSYFCLPIQSDANKNRKY